MRTLMDVQTLRERMISGQRTVLLDVRWKLGDRDGDGQGRYRQAHIPGAVYADLPSQLASAPSTAEGRHPLPEPEAFREAARDWGINNDDVVVAYDDNGGLSAARVWWLLRDGGFDTVYLLDGGLAAWRAEGYELDSGDELASLGNVELGSGRMSRLELDDVLDFAGTSLLLDARATERYRGELEPVDPRAGHIPGAVSAPTTENLAPGGHFLPAAELAARFKDLGTDGRDVAVYCGSGINAAHQIAAMAEAGIDAALFPGS
ncbi:MAG TPA: sulfurtransferase, partial [Arthrobacter sp.]|nr:sulfurtransferase [Arthrobacter sp.]